MRRRIGTRTGLSCWPPKEGGGELIYPEDNKPSITIPERNHCTRNTVVATVGAAALITAVIIVSNKGGQELDCHDSGKRVNIGTVGPDGNKISSMWAVANLANPPVDGGHRFNEGDMVTEYTKVTGLSTTTVLPLGAEAVVMVCTQP